MGNKVRVTVIATGFGKENCQKEIIAPAVVVDENNLDVPTILRRNIDRGAELKNAEIRETGKLGGFNVDDERRVRHADVPAQTG